MDKRSEVRDILKQLSRWDIGVAELPPRPVYLDVTGEKIDHALSELRQVVEGMKNNESGFPELEEDSPELNKMLGWNAAIEAVAGLFDTKGGGE